MSETLGTYNAGGHVTSAPQQAVAELSGYYAQIPAELIAAKNANAILLYGVIDRIAGKPDCFASLERLREDTGLSVRTIQRTRDWLVEQGFLVVVRQGSGHRATDYHIPFRSQRRGIPGYQNLLPSQSIHSNSDTPAMSETSFQGIEPSVRAAFKGQNPSEVFDEMSQTSAPKGAKRGKRVQKVFTLEDRERLIAKYAERLPDPGWHMDQALNHTASLKALDLGRYVDGWLRREAENPRKRGSPPASNGIVKRRTPIVVNPEIIAKAQRIREEWRATHPAEA